MWLLHRSTALYAAFLVLAAVQAQAQTITQSNLVAALRPTTDSTNDTFSADSATVFGQTLVLRPFDLTVLTNDTHSLVSFNVSKKVSQIGYLAVGFGTTMTDSAMVLLWPTSDEDNSDWVISLRSAEGHHQPTVLAALENNDPAGDDAAANDTVASAASLFSLQPSLRDTWTSPTDSSAGHALISFLRPLTIAPASSAPFAHSSYLNLSRSTLQKVIYAYSDQRPDGNDLNARIAMHDGGMFGNVDVDLSQRFLDPTTGNGTAVEVGQEWTKFDTFVYAHAPAGALIARLGRQWSSWFRWHASLQGYVTIPATFVVVALGLLVNYLGGPSGMNAHKFFGFLILFLVLILLGLGYWSHKAPFEKGTSRPWFRVAHILGGLFTIILGWIQIALGFGEYKNRPTSKTAKIIYAVFILTFIVLYGISTGLFIISRRREGRSWRFAVMGLGNDKANAVQKPWVSRMETWLPNSVSRQHDSVEEGADFGVILTGVGALFNVLGVLLFFNGSLIAFGHVFLAVGLPYLLGPGQVFAFFAQPEKRSGACFFLAGFAAVLYRWGIFGLLLEGYGFINLFGDAIPGILEMFRSLPLLGAFLAPPAPPEKQPETLAQQLASQFLSSINFSNPQGQATQTGGNVGAGRPGHVQAGQHGQVSGAAVAAQFAGSVWQGMNQLRNRGTSAAQ